MNEERFEVTEDHLKLLRRFCVGWQDCEAGAPEIDPKRPYGNSQVEEDVAEILGWAVDEDEGLSTYQRDKAATLHAQTATVLQIALCTGAFKAGVYVRANTYSSHGWRLQS